MRNADKLDELPLELAREEYEKVRDNKESFEDWYVGAVGYLGSYNDPPYKGTQGYGASFDFDAFVNWCKKMSEKNFVLVSEQDFPI